MKPDYQKIQSSCFVITLVAGICLGTVHDITLDPIAQAQEAAATKTYQEVYPDAASFDETAGAG